MTNYPIPNIHRPSSIVFRAVLAVWLCIAAANPLWAQFFYNETCRNATGIFQYYGDAIGYTAGLGIDPPGNGWLRLVNMTNSQNGYVLLEKTFPSTMGVTIEFDFKVWSSSANIADGFCVFLFDGTSAQPFQIGDPGGSLGYVNLVPAYLGIGIDEWGNFWNAVGGSGGMRKSAITIAKANYQYVAGTAAYLGSGTYLEYPTTSSVRPADTVYYRRVRIEMLPITNGMSVTVYLKTQPAGNFTAVLGPVDVIQATPSLLQLGFNAATGGNYGYHEVRDVVVRTPGDISVFKTAPEGCAGNKDTVIIHTVISNSTNTAIDSVNVSDTLPAGYTIGGGVPAVSSAGTMHNFATTVLGDGRTRCTYSVDVDPESVVYISYTGAFAVRPPGSSYTASVGITPPAAFEDQNLNDNYSAFSGCIAYHPLVNDAIAVLKGGAIGFDALLNDSLACQGTPTVGIVAGSGLHRGEATVNPDLTLTYHAATAGIDSLKYYVACEGDSSVATVYIVVHQPFAQQYIACNGVSVTMGFTPIAGVTYHWYGAATGGSILHSATTMSVVKGSAADIGTWWVEAVYDGMVFPRLRVDMTSSDNCGVTAPAGCAADGTLLFKEDFGGNSVSDPSVKASGIPQVVGYTYLANLNAQGVYTIAKQSPPTHETWYILDDHTYPGDPTLGYLIGFDASEAPGQFYEYRIDGLCLGTKLYFSAWLASLINNLTHADKSNLIFSVENTTGDVLARYYTGNIPDADPQWKIYGFAFTAPEASIVLKIVNNGTGSSGNDFVMDDIEIRFCAPEVAIATRDTAVCAGTGAVVSLEGHYDDDGLFGDNLTARWEFSTTGAIHVPSDWSPVAGSDTTVSNGTVESHYSLTGITPLQAGYYRLVVAGPDNITNFNCRAMSPVIHLQVDTVSAAPAVFTDDPTAFCIGGSALLESTATDAISYQWFLNEATIGGATAATCTATVTGIYTLRTLDSHGCPSAPSAPLTVTAHPYPDVPTLSATAATLCAGQTVTLTAAAEGASTWYWFLDDAPAGTTTASTVAVSAGGVYRVEVGGTGDCRTAMPSNNILLTSFPIPADPTLAPVQTDFCAGRSVTLTATAAGAAAYEWYRDNQLIAGLTGNTCTVYETGRYTVRAVNGYQCYAPQAADTVQITVHPIPLAPVIIAGGPPFYRDWDYSLAVETPESAVGYYWYRNAATTGVQGNSYPLLLLDNADAGVYTVEAISDYDCRAWSEPFVVTVEPSPLFIPNIFTPNDDGVNDNFRITGLNNYEGNDLLILNKRGKTVFSAVNYRNEWYGAGQPDDIYYYRLRLRNQDNTVSMYEGYVHIKRN
jgi:gliding motility-associated-like protein